MKQVTLILVLLAFFSTNTFAQEKKIEVVELRARIHLGEIVMDLPGTNKDSTGTTGEIRNIIKSSRAAAAVIKRMAETGWKMLSCMQVVPNDQQIPLHDFIAYYFQREL